MTVVDFDAPAARRHPFPVYRTLRERAPVHHIPGTDRYVVSRYEDVVHVTRHPELFSNKKLWLAGADPELAAIAATQRHPMTQSLVDNDPPGHTVYREIAFRAFAPARLRALEPRIGELIDALIDGFAGRGETELVSELCDPLPMRVICELLGLPQTMAPEFKRWSDDYLALAGRLISRERAIECQHSVVELNDYLADAIEARRARPEADVVSELAAAETPDGRVLDVSVLTSIARNLLTAGDETTSFLLANTVLLLLEHPDELRAATADPSRIPRLLEEALRVESPTQWLWRQVVADVELHGVTIPAGSWVHVVWASANRDPDVFDRPDEFAPERPNARRHLAFGNGIHFCLGAPLARLEGRVALERLLSRLRNLRLAGPVERLESANYRAVRRLPLRFEAA
jgi:cytochrome P450